ncbi:MAG: hypothetical protein KVP17_003011 [Porospora cf. gigantea B]|uniref:uncharacterized protein n=2 Tax=Porospora cf. gigantea B TaxID=2853592 RepID=UPI003571C0E6|nr:MAG: hypothetical protein KVP17_003011 [Porospora cf. gigantea B]
MFEPSMTVTSDSSMTSGGSRRSSRRNGYLGCALGGVVIGAVVATFATYFITRSPAPAYSEGIMVVAHRGASAMHPDESREAYLQALNVSPSVFWECDVNLLDDGTPVCLHEPLMDKATDVITNVPVETRRVDGLGVADAAWAYDVTGVWPDQMPGMFNDADELKYRLKFEIESRRKNPDPYHTSNLATPMTLDAFLALARVGGVSVFIELKHPSYYLAQGYDLVQVVRDRLLTSGIDSSKVWIECFDAEEVLAFKDDYKVAALVWDAHLADRASADDLVYGVYKKEFDSVGQFSHNTILNATPEWCKDNGIHAVSPDKQILMKFPEVISRYRDAGILVIPWTIVPESAGPDFGNSSLWEAVRFFEQSVDGLFLDDPETGLAAKTWLLAAERGWTPKPRLV